MIRWTLLGLVGVVVACGAPPAARDPRGFDRSATTKALTSVSVDDCRSPAGPFGQGHVVVAFDPNGIASDAYLDSGPKGSRSRFQDTPVGDCVVRKFAGVRVPPFSPGPPIKAGRNFVIRE